MKFLSTQQIANELGVHISTVINWIRDGKLKAIKVGKQYRIREEDYLEFLGFLDSSNQKSKIVSKCKIAIYARVSSRSDNNLENQVQLLKEYCIRKGYQIDFVIKDVGSSFNFKRRGLKKLLDLVISNNISKVVIVSKDRLSRIAFDLFQLLFGKFNVEIEVIDNDDRNLSDWQQQELVDELISFIHYITSKLYGSRIYKTKLRKLKECANHVLENARDNEAKEINSSKSRSNS